MKEKNKYPLHISDSIVESLNDMGDELSNPDAPALTEEMRDRATKAAKLALEVKSLDLDNEISGMDAAAKDLGMYYEETGLEPGVGKALEAMKPGHHEALVEKLNRPPDIPKS